MGTGITSTLSSCPLRKTVDKDHDNRLAERIKELEAQGIDPVAYLQPPSCRAKYTGSRGDTWSPRDTGAKP
jgi:hypothetical protein